MSELVALKAGQSRGVHERIVGRKGLAMAQTVSRKAFLLGAAGLGVVAAGGQSLVGATPASALRAAPPPTSSLVLGNAAVRTLGLWCDLLVPGAAEHRVTDFVTTQLAKNPVDALLAIRYFDWPPPWDGFYRDGLNAVDSAAETAFGSAFEDLSGAQRADLLSGLLAGTVSWSGPPFFLFYLVTRGDAVDVVYGVRSGYERIGLPYVPQVEPRRPW